MNATATLLPDKTISSSSISKSLLPRTIYCSIPVAKYDFCDKLLYDGSSEILTEYRWMVNRSLSCMSWPAVKKAKTSKCKLVCGFTAFKSDITPNTHFGTGIVQLETDKFTTVLNINYKKHLLKLMAIGIGNEEHHSGVSIEDYKDLMKTSIFFWKNIESFLQKNKKTLIRITPGMASLLFNMEVSNPVYLFLATELTFREETDNEIIEFKPENNNIANCEEQEEEKIKEDVNEKENETMTENTTIRNENDEAADNFNVDFDPSIYGISELADIIKICSKEISERVS